MPEKLLIIEDIEMVVFDLFGTLIRFGESHHPFRKVHRWAKENGQNTQKYNSRNLLTVNGDLEVLMEKVGLTLPNEVLIQCKEDIQKDLAGLTLFDDALPTLFALKAAGIRVALCSNLAMPYAVTIDKFLYPFDMLKCLSFEVGSIKPEIEIYEWLTFKSGLKPQNILFVGDTKLADYEGPKDYGFHALHLARDSTPSGQTINSLTDVLKAIRP